MVRYAAIWNSGNYQRLQKQRLVKNDSPTAIMVILSWFRLIHLDNSFCVSKAPSQQCLNALRLVAKVIFPEAVLILLATVLVRNLRYRLHIMLSYMFLLLLNRSESSIEKVHLPVTVRNTEDSAIPLKQQWKLKHEHITIPVYIINGSAS